VTKILSRGEGIRRFILNNVEKHPNNISKITANRFAITRQAVNKHLQKLINESALTEKGQTRNRIYKLATMSEWNKMYSITTTLAEDVIWRKDIKDVLGRMSNNVKDIWHYGFTEMFNNAIDHSEGKHIIVKIRKSAINTRMFIFDDGIGIFKKIQTQLKLLDESHAVLELSKGKLTTDPKNHSGEGIFFTSRMFDTYDIVSGDVCFSHQFSCPKDFVSEWDQADGGTFVLMELYNHTSRSVKKIFDKYTSGEEYGFNHTVFSVKLAQDGNDKLVSRSQAKRLLARVELFKDVIFDFNGVNSVGQAFADEIFRVFANQHPKIEFHYINANNKVKNMIERAKAHY